MENTTKKSKSRGELVIALGVMVVMVAVIGKIICPTTAPTWMLVSLNLAETLGLFVCTISLMTTGIRYLRQKCCYYKAIVFLIIGISVNVFNLYVVNVNRNFNAIVSDRPNIELLRQAINKSNVSIETRAKLSKQYAHNRYLYDGVKEKYITETGKMQVYEPTMEDDKFRQNRLLARKTLNNNEKAMTWSSYQWLFVTLLGFLLGFLTPIKRRSIC